MSKSKLTMEARVLNFFEVAPLPVVEAILGIVKAKVKERMQEEHYAAPVKHRKTNRKQKEMFPEAEIQV